MTVSFIALQLVKDTDHNTPDMEVHPLSDL